MTCCKGSINDWQEVGDVSTRQEVETPRYSELSNTPGGSYFPSRIHVLRPEDLICGTK